MSTKPSLALIPSAYKASKVYSVLPNDGTGDFDFSRATLATRINKDGLIETMGSNVPRLNYPMIDGVVSGCPSLLLEPARTNLVTYSEDFSDASWTKNNTNISNSVISPDGGLNGTKYTLDVTSDRSRISRVIFSIDTLYTASVFVKYNSVQYFYISNAGADAYKTVFDIKNGTIVSTGSSVDSSKIEDYGNGWYRCSATFTAAYTTLYFNFSPNTNDVTFTNTTDFSYIWGAQAEQGSYATSYIPTQGSAVTRVQETCGQTLPSGIIGQNEGVFYAEIKANETSNADNRRTISLSNNTNDNRVYISFDDEYNKLNFLIVVGTTTVTVANVDISNQNVYNKIAVKYKSGDSAIYVNGVLKSSFNDTFSGGVFDTLKFQNRGSGEIFNGKCKNLRVYNRALTNKELQALTS